MKPVIGVAGETQRRQTALGHVNSEFLRQLTNQGLFRAFIGFHLAAGKFPKTGHVTPLGTFGDEDAIVFIDQRTGDNQSDTLGHVRSFEARETVLQ